jgi:cytochrome c
MKLRSFFLQTATVLSFLAASTGVSSAVGNPALGEKVFKKCKACHKIGEGAENSTGPVLTGVVGRKAGTYPGYSYGKSIVGKA